VSTVLTDEQREMVLGNVALVEHIVNRVACKLPASYCRDDLVQTGIVGLITATARFDPANGAAFSTYAGRRIEGAIIDVLRQGDWAPRSVRTMERRLTTAEEKAQGNPEQLDELSRDLGLDRDQLERLRRDIVKARLDSLDRPVNIDGGGPTPLSATVIDHHEPVEATLDGRELVGYLRDGVALLPERHRLVIVGFFFEGRTMTELGALLGVTQSRASQIKEEALKMLRGGLDEVYRDSNDDDVGQGDDQPSSRQRQFNESLGSSRPWRERLSIHDPPIGVGNGPKIVDPEGASP